MNKLFGLFLLALAFLAPDLAQAANRWAVCATTCTWDNTSTAMWSSVGTGGATGATAPTSADDVIIDAATCVGGTTCTITTFAGTITVNSITMGACTASTSGCILDASVNNTTFSMSFFSGSGSGTRTLKLGNSTWTVSANFTGTAWAWSTTSSTLTPGSSTIVIGGGATNGIRTFAGGGATYNNLTLNSVSGTGSTTINGGTTFATVTLNSPTLAWLSSATTTTLSSLVVSGGSSSNISGFVNGNPGSGTATVSISGSSSVSWLGIGGVTLTGAGSLTATNSFNLGGNSGAGLTITAPSGGGGGGGRIIGG